MHNERKKIGGISQSSPCTAANASDVMMTAVQRIHARGASLRSSNADSVCGVAYCTTPASNCCGWSGGCGVGGGGGATGIHGRDAGGGTIDGLGVNIRQIEPSSAV